MDRRGRERYSLQAELSFLWRDGGMSRSARGLSRDFSSGGIFVSSEDLPPVGAHVRFEVSVHSVFAPSQLVILAQGRVVRVEAHGENDRPRGFAAVIEAPVLRDEKGEIVE
jgi:PilZ domain